MPKPKAKGRSPEELKRLRKKFRLGEFAPKVRRARTKTRPKREKAEAAPRSSGWW